VIGFRDTCFTQMTKLVCIFSYCKM
jgi:hypothetical protein